ncbi:phosphopantetheine-binding protein [Actinomycetospora cinnamomea]|uniref:Bifunctional isochorismate lyase/aryl carrier protein n=1 Tax=Actinomycetospora cinnamomea TaxID=663609 RepID=A0A2U1FR71_9PSEU|nr:phosphopantetheine-binding protein [Actinomycetospora cinnamomea]PVZ14656.1 bifunctional isochorismate lyase/aryl carrier protein [Actinomycetospora cinnamomea]
MATPDGDPAAAVDIERMRADVAAALEEPPEAIGDHDDLLDRGLDSIRLMSLVESWRSGGSEVGFIDLAETPTLDAWVRLLGGEQRGATT